MNRLHYFCIVVQTGSFAKAADLLRLSPAALSKSMRILQQELGCELFTHSGRGILITPEGHKIAEKSSILLNELLDLPRFAKGQKLANMDNKQLRLGSFEVFTTYFIGPMIQQFSSDFQLILHELSPGKIENALLEKRIDIGLSYIPIPHNDLDHLEVGRVNMGIFARTGYFNGVTELENLPFVVPVEPLLGAPNKAQGLDGWLPKFGHRQIKFKVSLMESALELVRQGLAVAYLPQFVVKLHNQYLRPNYQLQNLPNLKISLQTKSFSSVYLIKRKSDQETSNMKKIAKALRLNL